LQADKFRSRRQTISEKAFSQVTADFIAMHFEEVLARASVHEEHAVIQVEVFQLRQGFDVAITIHSARDLEVLLEAGSADTIAGAYDFVNERNELSVLFRLDVFERVIRDNLPEKLWSFPLNRTPS
jgi:hypothetical protein